MVINNNYLNSINRISANQPAHIKQKSVQQQNDFESILQGSINKNNAVKFSKHAELRLQSRNISLSNVQKEKINNAINKAEEKGIKDSLVLMDNMAFVVNIKNRIVITATNANDLKENVFTNIDGAVFA